MVYTRASFEADKETRGLIALVVRQHKTKTKQKNE